MKNYYVEKHPLGEMAPDGCSPIEKYLEAKLKSGKRLVSVVEYAGTPYWIYEATSSSKQDA